MEFRAVPNRVNQPPLREKFGENKIALATRGFLVDIVDSS